jgi:hypothetical protein
MKTRSRKFPGWLAVISAALMAFLAFVVLSNLADEEVKPAVKKILDDKRVPSAEEIRAQHQLWGLHAGETADPEEKGRELWEKFHSLPAEQRAGFYQDHVQKIKRPWGEIEFQGCENGRRVCTRAALKDEPGVREALAANQQVLLLYMKLLEGGAAPLAFMSSPEIPLLQEARWNLKLGRLMVAQWAVWLEKGGQERVLNSIERVNEYYRGLIDHGSTIDRHVGLMGMQANLEFLVQEAEANPRLRKIIPESLKSSFASPDPETMMTGAVDHELRVFANALNSLKGMEELGFKIGAPVSWLGVVLSPRLFYRRNETLNRVYDIHSQVLANDCGGTKPSEENSECIPALKWARTDSLWSRVDNPVGRALATMFVVDLSHTFAKLKDRSEKLNGLRAALEDQVIH